MKRILITGGAGFIGSNLAEKMLSQGWVVYLLDIKSELTKIRSFRDKVKYIHEDIRSRKLSDLLKNLEPDGIIHLAALSRVVWCEEKPDECFSVNVNGTNNLLQSISELRKKPWVIFSSSREVYGNSKTLPVKETFPLSPVSTYAVAKCAGENIIKRYSSKSGIKSIILRLSNVYGNERDIPDRVIPKFILNALRGEKITIYGRGKFFDFTFIDDVVSAILRAIERIEGMDAGRVETYNICTGKAVKLEELPSIISDITHSDVEVIYKEPRDYEVMGYYGDCSKAREHLGFIPEWDIRKGLEHTIERYRQFLGVTT